jgi:hypothetical protein
MSESSWRRQHMRSFGVAGVIPESSYASCGIRRASNSVLRRLSRSPPWTIDPRLLSPEEDHVETARELMRPVNNRNKAETAQRHGKEEGLERSGHDDLATPKNAFR